MALNGMDQHSLDLSGGGVNDSINDLNLSPIRLSGRAALPAVLVDARDMTGDRFSAMSNVHEPMALQYELEAEEHLVEVAERRAKVALTKATVEKLKSLSGSQRSRSSLNLKVPLPDAGKPQRPQQHALVGNRSWMSDGLARDLSALIGEDFLETQKREAATFDRAKQELIMSERAKQQFFEEQLYAEHQQRLAQSIAEVRASEAAELQRALELHAQHFVQVSRAGDARAA